MYKYFVDCETLEDVKRLYKKLVFMYHPDVSGSDTTATMQAINAEYEKAFEQYKNIFRNAEGETYTKENSETYEQYQDIINNLIHFEGITIEIIGSWLWVSGNTKTYKDDLKEMKFRFSSNKKAWYIRPAGYRKRSRKNFSMDDIRSMYGSETIEPDPNKGKKQLAKV